MSIYSKLPEINPSINEPFKGDLLNRFSTASMLTTLVDTFHDGCVIGLNGKWGCGKSTFLRMWEKQLEHDKYKVLHFNAWEEDYTDDPIIAILAAFDSISKEHSLLNTLGKVALSIIPNILANTIKMVTGFDSEILASAIKDSGDEITNVLKNKIDTYCEQKKTLQSFRKNLSEYAMSVSADKPVVFVIDELDRCNPFYAIKCLERVKHLFSVKNIVFVISIDKSQLCNLIKGYFGSENFNSEDYLRRFININFDLPARETKGIVQKVLEAYDFSYIQFDRNAMANFVPMLFDGVNLSIRQIEQFMLHLRLIIKNQNLTRRVSLPTIILLMYIKTFEDAMFQKFVKKGFTLQELVSKIEDVFPDVFFDIEGNQYLTKEYFYPAILDILKMYVGKGICESLLENDENLKFKVKRINVKYLISCIKDPQNNYTPIMSHIVEYINLATNIRV